MKAGKLRLQELVPPFTLSSSKGGKVKLWDYKMRKNLIIIIRHGKSCAQCRVKLEHFARKHGEFLQFDTEVVAVSPDNLEDAKELSDELSLPYPLLSDPEKEMIAKYTSLKGERNVITPAIFIIDRYGALVYQEISVEGIDLPDPDEVLEWIRYVENQCPECSHL